MSKLTAVSFSNHLLDQGNPWPRRWGSFGVAGLLLEHGVGVGWGGMATDLLMVHPGNSSVG